MTQASDLRALADRCEREDPSFELDGAIHMAVYPDHPPMPGRVRQINPTASLDTARTISAWVLLHASDIGADGMPLVVLGDPGTTPPGEVRGTAGRTLTMTWCAAALRARATELEHYQPAV